MNLLEKLQKQIQKEQAHRQVALLSFEIETQDDNPT
jgi:hypothetical protein